MQFCRQSLVPVWIQVCANNAQPISPTNQACALPRLVMRPPGRLVGHRKLEVPPDRPVIGKAVLTVSRTFHVTEPCAVNHCALRRCARDS